MKQVHGQANSQAPYWFEKTDGVLYAFIAGEVDMMIADEWKDAIEQELHTTYARNLVFDFSQVYFIDSSGLGVILGRYKTVSSRGGKVVIQGANEQVYKILMLSGFGKLMEVIPKQFPRQNGNQADLGGLHHD